MARPITLKKIQENLSSLPADDIQAVAKFIEFLHSSARKRKPCHLRQDWAGALQDFAGEYTSLKLQKLAPSWRKG